MAASSLDEELRKIEQEFAGLLPGDDYTGQDLGAGGRGGGRGDSGGVGGQPTTDDLSASLHSTLGPAPTPGGGAGGGRAAAAGAAAFSTSTSASTQRFTSRTMEQLQGVAGAATASGPVRATAGVDGTTFDTECTVHHTPAAPLRDAAGLAVQGHIVFAVTCSTWAFLLLALSVVCQHCQVVYPSVTHGCSPLL